MERTYINEVQKEIGILVSAYRYGKHCRKTFLWKPV